MIDFKPQNLNLTLDSFISTHQIVSEINRALDADKNYKICQPMTREYMKFLLDDAAGDNPKIGKIDPSVIPNDEMNSIKKDFCEIVGAVSIVSKRRELFPTLKIQSHSKIFFPRRGNEPLMDYKIREGDMEYKISAKSGKSTNTVKPRDILNLINEDDRLYKKVKDSTEYKVLTVLNEGSMVGGVLMAAGQILQDKRLPPTSEINFPTLKMMFNKAVTIGDAKFKNEHAAFIINTEKFVVAWSKRADLTNMFLTAASGKVYYLKLVNINKQKWIPEWDTIGEYRESDLNKLGVASFRSKNSSAMDSKGNVRISDKLGLQL